MAKKFLFTFLLELIHPIYMCRLFSTAQCNIDVIQHYYYFLKLMFKFLNSLQLFLLLSYYLQKF